MGFLGVSVHLWHFFDGSRVVLTSMRQATARSFPRILARDVMGSRCLLSASTLASA